MRNVALLAVSALLVAAACNTDPGRGKARAETREAVIADAAPSREAAVRHAFGASDSKLEFTGAKVTAKHEGSFGRFRGTIDLVAGDLARSRVEALVETASLSVEPDRLAQHLKSADFLDVERFPEARFVSTSIRAGGAGDATHTVTGNLTLHGVTRSVSFPANVSVGAGSVTVDAEFVIDRRDFGIVYPGMPDDLIRNDVAVRLAIRARSDA